MVVLRRIKHGVIWLSTFTSGCIPEIIEKAEAGKDICTPLVRAILTVARKWKQLKCPRMDEWMNKKCYIPAMECYSTLKWNEILICAIV